MTKKQLAALAAKITAKAENALADLEREMTIMQWPPEFREIMWDAVVQFASRYRSEAAAEARSIKSVTTA